MTPTHQPRHMATHAPPSRSTLSGVLVRSWEEALIADELYRRGAAFQYERPLAASDGSWVLPDFAFPDCRGAIRIWEHAGAWRVPSYRARWARKVAWYERHYPGVLLFSITPPDMPGPYRSCCTWPVWFGGEWVGCIGDVLRVLLPDLDATASPA